MKWCCSQLGSVFSLELAQLRNSLTQMCSEVRLLVMLGQDGSVHLEDGRDEGERLRGTRSRCHTSLNARWHFEWLASLRQVVFLVLCILFRHPEPSMGTCYYYSFYENT